MDQDRRLFFFFGLLHWKDDEERMFLVNVIFKFSKAKRF